MSRSFLGRLDIWTQRLNEWLGAFPRWHGGTWANPPEKLDAQADQVDYGPRLETFAGIHLHRESEWGYGAHDPGEVLLTNNPGRFPTLMEEESAGQHEANRVMERIADSVALDTAKRAITTLPTVAEVEEGLAAASDQPLDEVEVGGRYIDFPAEYSVAPAYGITNVPEVTFSRVEMPISPETLKHVDPKILERARQEELPPHAKGLHQPLTKLPPGRGKGKDRPGHRSNTRTSPQWRGRYCKECGKHSGGPRSKVCQHCFEPFK